MPARQATVCRRGDNGTALTLGADAANFVTKRPLREVAKDAVGTARRLVAQLLFLDNAAQDAAIRRGLVSRSRAGGNSGATLSTALSPTVPVALLAVGGTNLSSTRLVLGRGGAGCAAVVAVSMDSSGAERAACWCCTGGCAADVAFGEYRPLGYIAVDRALNMVVRVVARASFAEAGASHATVRVDTDYVADADFKAIAA